MNRKHALDVLIYVYEHPGEMQKVITDDGEGKVARRDRLLELIAIGLIRTESTGENWTAIRHFVTDEGARIAQGWLHLEKGKDQ